MAKEESDEAIVIVLSDANLSRYGIDPKRLVAALTSREPKVQAYSIFIGSLDNEAQLLVKKYIYALKIKHLFSCYHFSIAKSMPAGRGFVCMNLKELPQILKQIFASSVLHQNVT